jgi:hypothetical protein
MRLTLVGLGATLLFGSSARAQQEMDPTIFDNNPGMTRIDNRSTAQAAQKPAVLRKYEVNTASAAIIPSAKDSTLEASVSRMMATEAAIFVVLLAGIASIALYAVAATSRERELQVSSNSASYTTTTSATAHGTA